MPRTRAARPPANAKAVDAPVTRFGSPGTRVARPFVRPHPATTNAKFQRMLTRVQNSASKAYTHDPAGKKAEEAQKSARPPANDKLAGAKSNQVDAMKQTETGKPESDSFLAMLEAEVDKVLPKTL